MEPASVLLEQIKPIEVDEKLSKLIDGISMLAYHFQGGDYTYWKFPIDYIDSNYVLKKVLHNNHEFLISDFFKESKDNIKEYYKNTLAKIEDDTYFVHDSVRYIFYNYCLFKLNEDLRLFDINVKQCSQLIKVQKTDNKYYFSYSNEPIITQQIYEGIKHPWALKNLIRRNFSLMRPTGHGRLIDLDTLEKIMFTTKNTYDFSKFIF